MTQTARPVAPVLLDVLQEHQEEAGFLWTQWERALVAPDYLLAELPRLEARLLAHLDGLTAGGAAAATELLQPTLAEQTDPELRFAAAAALLRGGDARRLDMLLQRLAGGAPDPPLARALELFPPADLEQRLRPWLDGGKGQAVALQVLDFHRADVGPSLAAALTSRDPAQLAAALGAACGAAGARHLALIEAALGSEDPATRDLALTAGLIHGSDAALEACRQQVQQAQPGAHQALVLLALRRQGQDLPALLACLDSEQTRAEALWAVGFGGSPQAAQRCVELLDDAGCAALAAEALCGITGLDLAAEGLIAPRPPEPDEPLPLEHEDLDADLGWTPEQDLPLPDAEGVRAWWGENRGRLELDAAYIAGQPAGPAALAQALEQASMRRRQVHGLELALTSDGARRVQTRGWSGAQATDRPG